MTYAPQEVKAYFDEYAEREWHRLESTMPGRIKAAIHSHILQAHLRPGIRALDVGCGPGRFAMQMASSGAMVTLVDISPKQLELAKQKFTDSRLSDCVESYRVSDVTDLAGLDDETYDLTVCYGSVLSYVRDDYPKALAELLRVTCRGGTIVLSATSLYGTMRLVSILDAADFADHVSDHLDWGGFVGGEGVVMTRMGSREFHQPMALFSSVGLQNALQNVGLEVIEMATSNPTVAMGFALTKTAQSETAERYLTEMEISLCQRPGLVDSGEHIIAVARRP